MSYSRCFTNVNSGQKQVFIFEGIFISRKSKSYSTPTVFGVWHLMIIWFAEVISIVLPKYDKVEQNPCLRDPHLHICGRTSSCRCQQVRAYCYVCCLNIVDVACDDRKCYLRLTSSRIIANFSNHKTLHVIQKLDHTLNSFQLCSMKENTHIEAHNLIVCSMCQCVQNTPHAGEIAVAQ